MKVSKFLSKENICSFVISMKKVFFFQFLFFLKKMPRSFEFYVYFGTREEEKRFF